MDHSLYIGMILSTLSMNPHTFVFRLLPQKVSYQFDVIHTYKLITLPICNQCETLWVFGLTPNNHLLEQSFIESPLKTVKGSSLTTPFCSASTYMIKPKPGSNTIRWEISRLFHIYIDMILSSLSLSPHCFVFGLLPQKDSSQTRSFLSFTTFEHMSYVKHHLLGAHNIVG